MSEIDNYSIDFEEGERELRKRLANLTSNILNPFFLGPAIVLLLSFASASSVMDAIKWAAIILSLIVLPIFFFVLYLVRNGRIDAIFTNIRQQRTKIYLLGGLCTFTTILVLAYSGAPPVLVAGSAGALSTAFIFMFINLWWKISLHSALVAASASILVMLYGWLAVAAVILVAMTAWARVELKYHSLAQVTAGALLAVVISVGTLHPFLMT